MITTENYDRDMDFSWLKVKDDKDLRKQIVYGNDYMDGLRAFSKDEIQEVIVVKISDVSLYNHKSYYADKARRKRQQAAKATREKEIQQLRDLAAKYPDEVSRGGDLEEG